METAVVLFTRDLRVQDNPALAGACRAARTVVPIFVHDPAIRSGPHRDRFLAGSLADLRQSLRARGGELFEFSGDPVAETLRVARRVGALGVAVSGDVSRYAKRREGLLAAGCERERMSLRVFPGATVVPAGVLHPAGGEHYRVFTPFWRSWQATKWRDVEPAPERIVLPAPVPDLGMDQAPAEPARVPAAAGGFAGGESAGRARVTSWLPDLPAYGDHHDDLPGDRTSRLSPYLHFGCVSARELAGRVAGRPGAEPFLRQLCWRDFYAQVLAAFPDLPSRAYRTAAVESWRPGGDALEAWRAGQTGVPVVDAGMRQLAAEGWMHNRARLITASYLTKHLGVDWRAGARHFADLLLDADVANNNGNWQWVAGTGNDTKPYRRFNPIRQAERFDPDGRYVRRYVPELGSVPDGAVHQPWTLPPPVQAALRYPPRLETLA
ncbi:MAG TPA: deoxyribodipyrimidine photo-lyase [Micromonosporaceae bacterium]|nr:deoxyribodipyrimidine photo-lyase [Micromonosporaceae bacterium]